MSANWKSSVAPEWNVGPGAVAIRVLARNAGSAGPDAVASGTAPIALPAAPLSVTSITMSPMAPLFASGGPVTFTTKAIGGTGPVHLRVLGQRWHGLAPVLRRIRHLDLDTPVPGSYTFEVWIRNAGTSGTPTRGASSDR